MDTARQRPAAMSEPRKRGLFSRLFGQVAVADDIIVVPDTPPAAAATDAATAGNAAPGAAGASLPRILPGEQGFFGRLGEGLVRSSSRLGDGLSGVLTRRRLDADTLDELEDLLIQADLGQPAAARIVDRLRTTRLDRDVTDAEVRALVAEQIAATLRPLAIPLALDPAHRPHVILVVGVNGSGKTTTIGKLTRAVANGGLSAILVAGDTFRAAAIEQLRIWGERTGAAVIAAKPGSDPAALAFEAYGRARDEGTAALIIDTAGRLQNKTHLMAELEKIIRVVRKQDATAPHTVILTLDATTGQNALGQAEIFGKVAGVTGIVMTKLDGTAKGGILVALADKFQLPIYAIGIGEGEDDLEELDADAFARALVGLG